MPKLINSPDWYRLAKAQAAFESMGVTASADLLARHTDFPEHDIKLTLDDATYQEFSDQFRRRRFGLWADALAKSGVEIQQLMKTIGFKAMLAVEDLLDSDDDKVRTAAARLAFDFNPELERPVVRHEIVNRFSADEIEEAKAIVRKLQKPKLPELPDDTGPVN